MKKLQELTLSDKFLFDETMDIPEAHEAVLQIIFGDDNLKLLTPAQTEKEIRTAPWLRSIRLDVYAIDQEKRIYNTEAQKAEKKDLVKRSRFYQSLIDSSLLEPGEINFNQMNDTCIIMITPFDLFGEGRYQYTFRSRCDENPALSMEDGAIRIFLNSHGKNPEEVSPELTEFLKYMESTDAALAENSVNEKLKKIHKHVSQIKASEEMGVKYMQKWEEKVLDREEGRAEGRAEGQAEGRASEIYIIRNQIEQVQRTPEETAELLVLEPEYIKKVAELLEEYPEETDVQIAARILKAGVCE